MAKYNKYEYLRKICLQFKPPYYFVCIAKQLQAYTRLKYCARGSFRLETIQFRTSNPSNIRNGHSKDTNNYPFGYR